jgi:branched-subunit amino acid ABC-type transport system permease component
MASCSGVLSVSRGLSLIFSVGGVNLAHGAFYALGAYASVEITKYWASVGRGVVADHRLDAGRSV